MRHFIAGPSRALDVNPYMSPLTWLDGCVEVDGWMMQCPDNEALHRRSKSCALDVNPYMSPLKWLDGCVEVDGWMMQYPDNEALHRRSKSYALDVNPYMSPLQVVGWVCRGRWVDDAMS